MNRKIFLIFFSVSVFFVPQVFCMVDPGSRRVISTRAVPPSPPKMAPAKRVAPTRVAPRRIKPAMPIPEAAPEPPAVPTTFSDRISVVVSRLKTEDPSIVMPDIEKLVSEAVELKKKGKLSIEDEDALVRMLLGLAKERGQRSKALELMRRFEEKIKVVPGKPVYPDPDLREKGLEIYKLIAKFYANDGVLDEKEIEELLKLLEYLEENEFTPGRRESFAGFASFLATAPPVEDVGIRITTEQRGRFDALIERLKEPVTFEARIKFLYGKIDDVRQMDEGSINAYLGDLFKLCEEFVRAKAAGEKPMGESTLLDLLRYASLIPAFRGRSKEINDWKSRIEEVIVAPPVSAKPAVPPRPQLPYLEELKERLELRKAAPPTLPSLTLPAKPAKPKATLPPPTETPHEALMRQIREGKKLKTVEPKEKSPE